MPRNCEVKLFTNTIILIFLCGNYEINSLFINQYLHSSNQSNGDSIRYVFPSLIGVNKSERKWLEIMHIASGFAVQFSGLGF